MSNKENWKESQAWISLRQTATDDDAAAAVAAQRPESNCTSATSTVSFLFCSSAVASI